MSNDKFSIKEALKYGWEAFKANIPFFLGLVAVMALLTVVPDMMAQKIFEPRSAGLMVTKIILRLLGLAFGMVATRLSLDLYDSGHPDLGGIGAILPRYPAYLAGKVLYGLIVLIGLILLVVPGIIVSYMFLYVGYLIVDRGLGPIEALQESRVLTDGYKMDLFLFSLAVLFMNILGVICLVVGLVVTLPVTMMASVYVYRKLSPAESA